MNGQPEQPEQLDTGRDSSFTICAGLVTSGCVGGGGGGWGVGENTAHCRCLDPSVGSGGQDGAEEVQGRDYKANNLEKILFTFVKFKCYVIYLSMFMLLPHCVE